MPTCQAPPEIGAWTLRGRRLRGDLVPTRLPGHPGRVPIYRGMLVPIAEAATLGNWTPVHPDSTGPTPAPQLCLEGPHGPHPSPSFLGSHFGASPLGCHTNTTGPGARATDTSHSAERSLRPRCQQGWLLRRPHRLAYRWPSSSCVFTESSLCPKLFHVCFKGVDLLFPYSKAVD